LPVVPATRVSMAKLPLLLVDQLLRSNKALV
jgi:hypothetical protein